MRLQLLLLALPFGFADDTVVLLRVLWIRHGLSCANVLSECTTNQTVASALSATLLPLLEDELRAAPPPQALPGDERPDLARAALDPRLGIVARDGAAAEAKTDCAVRVVPDPADVRRRRAGGGAAGGGAAGGGDAGGGDAGDGAFFLRVHDLYQDPVLTDCAVYQSRAAGRALRALLRRERAAGGVFADPAAPPDGVALVGSSTLARATSTAQFMFEPEALDERARVVHQLPYLVERWTTPDGATPLQQDNAPPPPADAARFFANGRHGRNASDWARFVVFAARELVPALVPALGAFGGGAGTATAGPPLARAAMLDAARDAARGGGGATVVKTIAVVGHGEMIRDVCALGRGPKPPNNAAYEKLLLLRYPSATRNGGSGGAPAPPPVGESVTTHDLAEPCLRVMGAPRAAEVSISAGVGGGAAPYALAARDIAACTEPFAVAPLLGLGGDLGGEPAAAARGRTDCEAAADAERAFTPGPALALPRDAQQEL